MIEVGDKISFTPSAYLDHMSNFAGVLRKKVTGMVVQVNEEHRWYRVEYPMPGCIGHECFKF